MIRFLDGKGLSMEEKGFRERSKHEIGNITVPVKNNFVAEKNCD